MCGTSGEGALLAGRPLRLAPPKGGKRACACSRAWPTTRAPPATARRWSGRWPASTRRPARCGGGRAGTSARRANGPGTSSPSPMMPARADVMTEDTANSFPLEVAGREQLEITTGGLAILRPKPVPCSRRPALSIHRSKSDSDRIHSDLWATPTAIPAVPRLLPKPDPSRTPAILPPYPVLSSAMCRAARRSYRCSSARCAFGNGAQIAA